MRIRKNILWAGIALSISTVLAVAGMAGAAGKAAKKVKDPRVLVYETYTFNGKGYTQSFIPTKIDTFSIVSGVNNVITPKVSSVIWSEDDGEYTADWDNWEYPSKEVGDRMEILKNDKVVKVVKKQDIAIYLPDSNDQERSTLLSGKKARDEYNRYNKETEAYWDASSKYYDLRQKYEDTVQKLKGKPGAVLPKEPVQPQQPVYYVSKPIKAFVVDLAVGKYTIRTLDKNGKVLKDSEKKLEVFTHRRTGIGYHIIPESEWTYPVQSDDPTSIIYYVGERDLYFNPQDEKEYNLHDYTKLMKPNAPFSDNAPRDRWNWVYTEARSDSKLKLYKNGKLDQTIVEKPYVVEQTPGAALGYNILDWNPKDPKSTQPTFKAHKIVLRDKGVFTVKYVGKDGKENPTGYREMRPVKEVNPNTLFIISFIPVLAGLAISLVRVLKTRTSAKHSIGA
jgi:hypothetical protein